jgi:F-type H+-transporting ATPase subunit delta
VAADDTMTATVAGRYASALFDLAQEQKSVAAVEADLTRFDRMLHESADLRSLVRSPVLSADDQGRALQALFAKAGISGITGNFLLLVAKNRRLFAVSDITKIFHTLAARSRGEVSAEVTSAVALTPAQTQALSDQLKATVGKDVKIAAKVDPSLLGGLVVKVGSRMIDSSLKTKLANMSAALKASA